MSNDHSVLSLIVIAATLSLIPILYYTILLLILFLTTFTHVEETQAPADMQVGPRICPGNSLYY